MGGPQPISDFEAEQDVVRKLRERLGSILYDRWFSRVRFGSTGSSVCLLVPNLMHQYWIEEHYLHVVREIVRETLQDASYRDIEFRVEFGVGTERSSSSQEELFHLPRPGPEETPPTQYAEGLTFSAEERFANQLKEAGLNPQFSFGSYVVGPNCTYSFAAARAVAEKPGRIYNPLFVHGAVGLGKTHLVQAIGQEILRNKPRKVVRYVTSESFTNEYIEAIRLHRLNAFRQKYRKVDVLIIDDIQFFAGKGGTQEEVFHTFNDLFNSFKQIILTSDRAPSEIKNLEDRLVSRFEWGMASMIEPPDVETRTAILRQKVLDKQIPLDNWVLTYLAENVVSNVRRLEGALMRIAVHASLDNVPALSPKIINSLIADIVDKPAEKTITIELIQRVVSEHFELGLSDMTSHRRPAQIAIPRQIAFYLSQKLTKESLRDIGMAFGGRDHGTVIHACKATSNKVESDAKFRGVIEQLIEKIQQQA